MNNESNNRHKNNDKTSSLLLTVINRETALYAVFGVLTTIENILLFKILFIFLDYKIANIITLVIVKITAYVCNKNFVFHSHCNNLIGLFKEFIRFIFARGLTALLDYFGLILLVEIVGTPKIIGKVIVTIVVVIINYVIGKKHVFKDAKKKHVLRDANTEKELE